MCVAVPGEILSIGTDGSAVADFGGTRRAISIALLEEVAVGDFVIVHAGFALRRMDPAEARETLSIFREFLDDECT